MLAAKYSLPAWALVQEVPNATSVSRSRACDGLAFGCWRSEGLTIEGFEIKSVRSDWLRELQDRSKAATFERYCHHWWIVASPGIVKLAELPAEWGLMEPAGNGLRVKSAPSLRKPDQMPLTMLSALIRKAIGGQDATRAIATARREGLRQGKELARKERKAAVASHDNPERRYLDLKRAVDNFEEASGIKIETYSGRRVGEAFAAFQRIPRKSLNDRESVYALRLVLKAWEQFEESWNREVLTNPSEVSDG